MLKQVLVFEAVALKCYSCVSGESMSKCKENMVSTNCTILGSSFDHCVSVSLDAKEDGKRLKASANPVSPKRCVTPVVTHLKTARKSVGRNASLVAVIQITATVVQWPRSALP